MTRSADRLCGRRAAGSCAAAALIAAALAGSAGAWQAPVGAAPGPGVRTVPTDFYFAVLEGYHDGNYREALRDFQSAARSAIKNGPNLWIDSICYQTMIGECYYQMGQPAQAVEHYSAALKLYLAFSDWMIPVKFDPAIRPAAAGQVKAVPWGQSIRNARMGAFKDTTLISQGRIDQSQVVQQGGVVQQAVLFPINAQEIVRCTALAIRRRAELMGPLCEQDAITNELIAKLTRRPVQPNHWSEAWIDVQLGLAYAAAGKDAQAIDVLKRAIVAGGEYDHPLTSTVLLALGRLALRQNDFDSASRFFDEATYTAVNFYDPGVLEEAFRCGFLAHVLANRKGVFPPLVPAAEWARGRGTRHFQASIYTLAAENYCLLPQADTKTAARLLDLARTAIGRRDMAAARPGARFNFVQALIHYQTNNVQAGDTALTATLNFQRSGSNRLFQIALADSLFLGGGLSERAAMEAFDLLLADPAPMDWLVEPIESLSVLVHPHDAAFERWFDIALARREYERALEIADLARRHRFLARQELGGRLLSLRWVLEGPAEMLDRQTALARQELLVRYPGYDKLSQRVRQLRAELAQAPLLPADQPSARAQAQKLEELLAVGQAQEILLREVALRREPATLVFPPFRSTKVVRESLPDGHALLSFFATSKALHGFLMTNDKFAQWRVGEPAAVEKQVVALLKELGNFDQNKELRAADVRSTAWKKSAADLLDTLTKDSGAKLPYNFQELIVVPDGITWHVPFEALQSNTSQVQQSLISQVRIRYAPTVGLAVADPRPRRRGVTTAVVLGRLFPNDSDDVTAAAFSEIADAIPSALALRGVLPAPSPAYARLIDQLITLADIAPPAADNPFNWAPIPLDRTSVGALGNWFRLPWGAPETVILPGFHTPAENALKGQSPGTAGAELFYSTCGLMALGARTVMISRWRPGGQSSIDLAREFAQELPHTTAADAWQRSVQLVTTRPLNGPAEPRVRIEATDDAILAEHPFFWSAFMVLDTGTAAKADDVDPAADVLKVKPAEEAEPPKP